VRWVVVDSIVSREEMSLRVAMEDDSDLTRETKLVGRATLVEKWWHLALET
jgi:hypothetical protein